MVRKTRKYSAARPKLHVHTRRLKGISLTESAKALATALSAARAAAEVHRHYLGQVAAEAWTEKGSADYVTHVDREAEARIVEIIRRDQPGHEILAEEAASEHPQEYKGAEWLWIVDPLDGTTNFLHGYPMYCASVALLHHGEPFVGAVVSGSTSEEWAAVRGGGAFRNGQRIHVSDTTRFDRALIGTGFPFKYPRMIEKYVQQFERVMNHVSDIRRAGSAAVDLCHLASGYLDAFWELDLKPWDYAAGVLMIREAGGIVNGLFDLGERTGAPDWHKGGGIIAGNPHVYSMLHDVVRGANL
jgi:myo-inositol-1(or 4)-monophosphatase